GHQFAASLPPSALSFSTHQIAHPNAPAPPPSLSQQEAADAAAVPPSISRVPYPTSTLRSSFEVPPATVGPGGAAATAVPAAAAAAEFKLPRDQRSLSLSLLGDPSKTNVPEAKDLCILQVIIVGDAGVGKTCLSFRFCKGRFPEFTEVCKKIDLLYRSVSLEGEILKVQLWDTAGQERYRQSIVAHYYRNVHAVVSFLCVQKCLTLTALP
ncbi:hypothetical protein PMAYCL1PPCAC_10495, partial [Pristionchus mayeri]